MKDRDIFPGLSGDFSGVLCDVGFLVPSHSLPGPSIAPSFVFKMLCLLIYLTC